MDCAGQIPDNTIRWMPRSALVRRVMGRIDAVFERLGAYLYINPIDRADFSYYRASFEDSLRSIDERIDSGALAPLDLRDFPLVARWPRYEINAALFIGSFDPFQMTHVAMALRYLASPGAAAPIVFVVPEGHVNPFKPLKSDYEYRRQLVAMQLEGAFEPLVVSLDIGRWADTIEIVRRFIALFPGSRLKLTHLLGSDALPYAVKLLPEDLGAWQAEASRRGVDFSYRAFVVRRLGSAPPEAHAAELGRLGLSVYVDDSPIGAPSSTDFRESHTFSIVFPTESVIRHMEILFRYNLNNPWRVSSPGPQTR